MVTLLRVFRRLFGKSIRTLLLVLLPTTSNTNLQNDNRRSLRNHVKRRRHTSITTIRRGILNPNRVTLLIRRGNTSYQINPRDQDHRTRLVNTSRPASILPIRMSILFTIRQVRPRQSLQRRYISNLIILKIFTHTRYVRTSNTRRHANVRVGMTRLDHRATHRHKFTHAYEPVSHGEGRVCISLSVGCGLFTGLYTIRGTVYGL